VNKNQITLGSLFDGIGGFPYAGSFFGIKPLWASEIMPQAISVTTRHFPEMEHVGDITALDGGALPPVDIITFGSPCQGLSMAGRRLGLADERSGLFGEAIRIIEEMRDVTNGLYPRYAVWENVPGALSSNSGFDYQAVLEAFTKTEVPIPRSGKWANAGMVRGGGIDLAWCVYNAQHFGVPQRRRRIFLVCDFGGRSAGEVLFIPKSLSGYFAARRAQGQTTAADAAGRADGAGVPRTLGRAVTERHDQPDCLNPWDTQQSRIFTGDGQSPTLAGADGGGGRNPAGLVIQDTETKHAAFLGGASAKARSIGYSEEVSPTLKGEPCGFNAPCVVVNDQGGDSLNVEKAELSPTLRSETHGNLPIVALTDTPAVTMRMRDGCEGGGKGPLLQREKSGTLASGNDQYLFIPQAVGVHQNQLGDVSTAENAYALSTNGNATGRNAPLVCENIKAFTLDSDGSNSMKSSNPLSGCREVETARTLDTTNPCPAKNQGGLAIVGVHPEVCGTLCASASGLNRPGGMGSETDLCVAYCLQGNMIGRQEHNGPRGAGINEETAFTLTATDVSGVATVFNRLRSDDFKEGSIAGTQAASQCKGSTDLVCEIAAVCFASSSYGGMKEGVTTLRAEGGDNGGGSENLVVSKAPAQYIVRRLLPVECERLQGYPDGWTEFGHDGKPISDTRRYQMLGNSVAVPCVAYILMGIAEEMRKEAV